MKPDFEKLHAEYERCVSEVEYAMRNYVRIKCDDGSLRAPTEEEIKKVTDFLALRNERNRRIVAAYESGALGTPSTDGIHE